MEDQRTTLRYVQCDRGVGTRRDGTYASEKTVGMPKLTLRKSSAPATLYISWASTGMSPGISTTTQFFLAPCLIIKLVERQ